MLPWKDLLLVLVLAALFALASVLDHPDRRTRIHWRVFPPTAMASTPSGCVHDRTTQFASTQPDPGR